MLKATTGMVQSNQTTFWHRSWTVLHISQSFSWWEGKSAISNWTDKLQSRYQTAKPPIVVSTLPQGWLPQMVILDAMFLINTKPLRRTKILANYTQLMFERFALEHFKAGASEIHLIFDKPGQQLFNPKQFEHAKRDCTQKMSLQHQHISFTPETALPQAWPEYWMQSM